jgi:hypothetical protein
VTEYLASQSYELAFVWNTIFRPSGSENVPERTIASIAGVDERLKALERRRKPKISIPLDGGDPSAIVAALSRKHAVVAWNEGLIVVNIAARASRLLSAGPNLYNR